MKYKLITGLTLPHFCACLPGTGFPTLYVVVLFCVQLVKMMRRLFLLLLLVELLNI